MRSLVDEFGASGGGDAVGLDFFPTVDAGDFE